METKEELTVAKGIKMAYLAPEKGEDSTDQQVCVRVCVCACVCVCVCVCHQSYYVICSTIEADALSLSTYFLRSNYTSSCCRFGCKVVCVCLAS